MDRSDLALRIQLLPTVADRILLVGEIAGLRADDDWFTPGDIARLFESLRLPRPGNVSEFLRRLENRGLVRRRSTGGWSLTPLGRQNARLLIARVDPGQIQAALAHQDGAELGRVRHPLLPPELAPHPFVPAIDRLLERFDFASNVFCMTRFPSDQGGDPLKSALPAVQAAIHQHGLASHLASDQNLSDDLWGNVAAYMWACRFGVAVFENRLGRDLNKNLLIEVGAMLALGRRCALLKDVTVERMPTDFVGHIYKEVDLEEPDTVSGAVHQWLAEDLTLGACPGCAK